MAAAASSPMSETSLSYAERCISNARSNASNLELCAYKLAVDEHYAKYFTIPFRPDVTDKHKEKAQTLVNNHVILLDEYIRDFKRYPEMEFNNIKHSNPLYEKYSIKICRQFSEGHYNVYVILPDDHPDVGKFYDEIEIETHFSLSFSRGNMFGIDFAHRNDFTLITSPGQITDETKVWTFEEVKAEGLALIEKFYARAH